MPAQLLFPCESGAAAAHGAHRGAAVTLFGVLSKRPRRAALSPLPCGTQSGSMLTGVWGLRPARQIAGIGGL